MTIQEAVAQATRSECCITASIYYLPNYECGSITISELENSKPNVTIHNFDTGEYHYFTDLSVESIEVIYEYVPETVKCDCPD